MNSLLKFKSKTRLLFERYPVIKNILLPVKLIVNFYFQFIASDKLYYRENFSNTMGYYFDFDNPKTLNEKIQVLKLYDRTDLHTQCADKIEVRKYVSSIIGHDKLVPLINVLDDVNKFNMNLLPEFPVIIKASHDSGSTLIILDKKLHKTEIIKSKLISWVNRNYYSYSREWQYKNIQPRILIEKLLNNLDGKIPADIKAHCINGKVEFFQIDIGRGTENHFRDFYFSNWEKAPFSWNGVKDENGKRLPTSNNYTNKPSYLEDLIKCSEKLSKPFAYVRVDWYDCGEKFYFGELTFHHDSGFVPILPKKWDLHFGNKVKFNHES